MRNAAFSMVLAGLIVGSVFGADSVAFAQSTPSTQPATQPTTQPAIDLPGLMAVIEAAGGIYTAIHEAVEKGDLETAAQLSSDLLQSADAIRAKTKGSLIEVPVNMGLTQLTRLHEALVARDGEKAKTIMAGLDRIGMSISETVERLAHAPTTQPAK